ncbi:FtsK/SpoIIIE domain-containing protein [Dethiobacter alkaliphilus]|uniref:FtsK/SpoIIIE domain-containing protein n=1 Tax=Dethiobacter alkaliphilus TaxID=427926 RepID=UPI0022265081|nr:FtsK/SpoIIIE domain-containing protein [Dethiobacter alkaliphilus]MCW3488677.1 FtsK/SpoIIIE domain-containing protein [Dethiobacter alkaliphilus]
MNKRFTREEFWQRSKTLPEDIQDLHLDERVGLHISDICQSYGIDESKNEIMELVTATLIGVLPPAHFAEELEKELNIGRKAAEKIYHEINQTIFSLVKGSLAAIYGTGTRAAKREQIVKPRSEGKTKSRSDLESFFPTLELETVLPALTPLKDGRGILFQADGDTKAMAIGAVQSMALRLLATIPPGKVKFLFIDPVGLGQNVAHFIPLADYEESLVSSRAWSEQQHIEQRLADISEHIETVIQKYLRTEFDTIEEYNEKAGETAEPYRVVVVMDFPVNFSDTSARRLQSIAQNGPRCGVYTLIVMDKEKDLPYDFNLEDLERVCEVIAWEGGRFVWQDDLYRSCKLQLDWLPSDVLVNRIVHTVGEQAKETMKVEVPFEKLLNITELEEQTWWGRSAAEKIEIPLGPAGARKVQHLTFGTGTAHHALIVGRPGSGKSNLMHIIITAAALAYSPDEVQFYLVDFKKGVEFKSYTDPPLPHARVVAVESEREFGLSVLQGLDAELQRRGELFRQNGVNSFADCRRRQGEALPRIILLVDEFQEFFVQDDNVSREAGLILDRLVRQGRAFGMHVMLGSQTLAGSYTLPRSTLDQMAVRIALQCSETDSRLILADDNPGARLLARPGEAIYNAASGLVEGNNLFQVALFGDKDRLRYLDEVKRKADNSPNTYPAPVIFEGHDPAFLENCAPLKQLLSAESWTSGLKTAVAFLGEPVAIKPPTSARFRRQSGSHLLVVTREEEEGIGLLTSSWLSLAAHHSPAEARFYILDFCSADADWADLPEVLEEVIPHTVNVLGRRDLPGLFSQLVELTENRQEKESSGEERIYLFVQGLHRIRDLRRDDQDFGWKGYDEDKTLSLPEQFTLLLIEGPEVGIHVLCWCDTYGNLMRALDRRSLNEFAQRATGVLSADDSMNLLDDPAASRLDKPHRMVFFDEERPGHLEKFRPYAIPEKKWLREVVKKQLDNKR